MTQPDLLELLHFNYWANHRILACAAKVTVEQLMEPTHLDHGSAFQTLLHLLDTEWGWRLLAQRLPADQMLWEVTDLADLAKVQAAWRVDETTMLAYAQGLDEAALNQEIELGTTPSGNPKTAKLWQILVHVIDHSAQHRSELARYFTICGHSPGDLNFLDFLFSQGT
jgi:uncharacterized damage-inducible protein DinB